MMTVDEAKRELHYIRSLDKALKSAEDEISRYRSDIYSLQATDYSKDKVQTFSHSDLSDKICRLTELKYKADRLWDRLIDERTRVILKIRQLDKPIYQSLLIEYYICGKTWGQVCVALSYSWKQIHRLHAKALECYGKIEDDIE